MIVLTKEQIEERIMILKSDILYMEAKIRKANRELKEREEELKHTE